MFKIERSSTVIVKESFRSFHLARLLEVTIIKILFILGRLPVWQILHCFESVAVGHHAVEECPELFPAVDCGEHVRVGQDHDLVIHYGPSDPADEGLKPFGTLIFEPLHVPPNHLRLQCPQGVRKTLGIFAWRKVKENNFTSNMHTTTKVKHLGLNQLSVGCTFWGGA